MTAPVRIQRRRSRGWRLPPGVVIVDRTTPWGNPYRVGVAGSRGACVRFHAFLVDRGAICLSCRGTDPKDLITHLAWVRSRIHLLVGKVLACWCRPDQECHADNLVALAAATERERGARARESHRRYAHQRLVANQ